jgi:hypothetical protein
MEKIELKEDIWAIINNSGQNIEIIEKEFIKYFENREKEIKRIVIEDVPHKYQRRILEILLEENN